MNDNVLTLLGVEDSGPVSIVMKECRCCHKMLPLTEFHKKTAHPDGLNNHCKNCRKKGQPKYANEAQDLMRELGLTRPALGTPCDCCGRTDKMLFCDHCHERRIFRGWLCPECNTGLAKLGDTIDSVKRVLEYLNRTA